MVSKLIRAQIRIGILLLGHDCPVPILPLRWRMLRELWEWGPSFRYRGDEIVWDWRKRNWTSICCEGIFPTLSEIDRFWREYEEYEARALSAGEC